LKAKSFFAEITLPQDWSFSSTAGSSALPGGGRRLPDVVGGGTGGFNQVSMERRRGIFTVYKKA
jgi:hypothetical protein